MRRPWHIPGRDAAFGLSGLNVVPVLARGSLTSSEAHCRMPRSVSYQENAQTELWMMMNLFLAHIVASRQGSVPTQAREARHVAINLFGMQR